MRQHDPYGSPYAQTLPSLHGLREARKMKTNSRTYDLCGDRSAEKNYNLSCPIPRPGNSGKGFTSSVLRQSCNPPTPTIAGLTKVEWCAVGRGSALIDYPLGIIAGCSAGCSAGLPKGHRRSAPHGIDRASSHPGLPRNAAAPSGDRGATGWMGRGRRSAGFRELPLR